MHSAIFAMRPIFAIMICECGGDVLIMNESWRMRGKCKTIYIPFLSSLIAIIVIKIWQNHCVLAPGAYFNKIPSAIRGPSPVMASNQPVPAFLLYNTYSQWERKMPTNNTFLTVISGVWTTMKLCILQSKLCWLWQPDLWTTDLASY
jgi:hypothetical protein